MNCEIYNKNESSPIGASISVLHNIGMLCSVGGSDGDSNDTYLKIRCMDIKAALWAPTYIDSNSIKNRSFHASAAIQNKLYLFGGCVAKYENETFDVSTSDEIIKIESARFGMAASVQMSCDLTSKQGLSANTVGPEMGRAVVFGGCSTRRKDFVSDVYMFTPGETEDDTKFEVVEVDQTVIPPARAYHSSAISGDMNQFLIVYGGMDEFGGIINDVWVLDLTEILLPPPPPVEIDPKAKKGKAEEHKVPMARWNQIAIEEPKYSPRYMHSSFVLKNASTDSLQLYIFGGISPSGALPLEEIKEIRIAKNEEGVYSHGEELTVSPEVVNAEGTEEVEESKGYDPDPLPPAPLTCYSASVALVSDTLFEKAALLEQSVAAEGEEPVPPTSRPPPVMIFVFGGSKEQQFVVPSREECDNVMIVLDPTNDLVKRVRRNIRKNLGLPPLQPPGDPDGMIKVIDYPNGDHYDGQVRRLVEKVFTEEDDPLDEQEEEDPSQNHLVYIPLGHGTMVYKDSGNVYEGAWVDGIQQGEATLTTQDGTTYKGHFVGGKKCGLGYIKKQESHTYHGAFYDDLFEGKGVMTMLNNGDVFTGEFVKGMKEGSGSITRADGSESTGTWKKDKMVGPGFAKGLSIRCVNTTVAAIIEPLPGTIEGADGLQQSISSKEKVGLEDAKDCATIKGVFTGPTDAGIPFGEEGTCSYIDGSEYVGQWKSGKRNGNGVFVFPNLDKFNGKWVGDKRCGQGKLVSVLMADYEGIWEDDKPHGLGTMASKDGTIYTGDFVAGRREGAGKLSGPEPDQLIFDGGWFQDDPVFPKPASVGGGSVSDQSGVTTASGSLAGTMK